MSKDVVKEIPWNKVVSRCEEISGIPRKQVDEVSNQLSITLETILKENQPKRDGDSVVIKTPFTSYTMQRMPSSIKYDEDNKQFTVPAHVGMNISIPRHYINAANIGLIDKATDEEEKKKAKSA